MAWPPTVTVYKEDNSTEYTEMNKPLADLTERTDWLKQQVDQITAGRNLVALYANVDDSVAVGDAVYLDTATGIVKPALARFANEYAADGSLRLADSGYVLGLVTEKPNATSARVFTNGTYEDLALANTIFGPGASPGIYRLSMGNAGELTTEEQELDILVAVYQGDGIFTLFDKRASIPNHIHQIYKLIPGGWFVDTDAQFDEMEKPEYLVNNPGAGFGYDLASDPDVSRLFPNVPSLIRIYGDGDLLLETEVIANVDNIWWLGQGPVPSAPDDFGTLEVAITTPYSFGEPILRGARSDTPTELLLSADQGILTANMSPWAIEDVTEQATAIVGLDGRTAERGPMVSRVDVIGDLERSVNSQGVVTLSLGLGLNQFIEPQIVNLNNSIEASDGYYVYYALPSSRNASMLGRISIPYFTGANLAAAVVAEVHGLSGGGSIPQLTVNYSVKNYPSLVSYMGSVWDGSIVLPTPAIPANNALIVETAEEDRFLVTSKGTVYVELSLDNIIGEDVKIARFGVILYVVE
jgi:hypothetical protein